MVPIFIDAARYFEFIINADKHLMQYILGMNVNIRETSSHVEFEPSSYYAAFSCELEASAYPMWSIISHLKDASYAQLSKKIMSYLINYLQDWLDAVNFQSPRMEKNEMMHASFHFPLHRYLAAFIYQAVKTMNISLNDILPEPETIKLLLMHPLRVQVSFKNFICSLLTFRFAYESASDGLALIIRDLFTEDETA